MILEDFHIHTTFCDGSDSPEEILRAAIFLGMKKIGFSCHNYTYFDESYCIKKDKIKDYMAEVRFLTEKYRDKIEVFCGTETDYYSDESTEGFDYVIGSVHYLKKNGSFFELDNSQDEFMCLAESCYDGDYFKLCEDYYKNVGDLICKTNADIIGHFDLVTKFNEGNILFDTSNARYLNAAKNAADSLLKYNVPFEINTGAVSRGYKTEAYPENTLLKYILESGGKVILSSDSHSADALCNHFEKYEKIVEDMGFKVHRIRR